MPSLNRGCFLLYQHHPSSIFACLPTLLFALTSATFTLYTCLVFLPLDHLQNFQKYKTTILFSTISCKMLKEKRPN
uniref:Uncharacterized protein n=1 Tax=Poecilia mexicana TaxID=48701 RepID=A0A3B3YP41_9TELE